MDEVKKIMDYLDRQEEEMHAFLKEMVSLETPSRVSDTQASILDLIGRKLTEAGMVAHHYPGEKSGGLLLGRPLSREKGRAIQLMIGHCDTVWPLGTLKEMPIREGEGGQLHGPGVYDMKAGLTQVLFALEALHVLGFPPALTPVVLINSDEEIGSKESTSSIRRLAGIAERAFVLEPPLGLDGKLKTARKGLGRFTIRVRGRAAHAGLKPEEGVNAIVELSHQIQELFRMNDPEKGVTVNVGMVEGGISPNVVAPEGKAVVDVRVLSEEDARKITEKIFALKPAHPEVSLSVEGGMGRPPMERTPRNQILWQMARQEAEKIGLTLEEGTAGGGSDGNTTSQYTATLDGLGTPGDGAHARHEYIFIEKLKERTALLALLLLME
jgi:glutamate carboxypeptidase